MDFNKLPEFPRAGYEIDVFWKDLKWQLKRYSEDCNLNLSPDYQRAHVWTIEQQIAYVEYCLMGGEVAKNITFNSPNWMSEKNQEPQLELVDGKQRLQAVLDFLDDKISIFGGYKCSEITGNMRGTKAGFKFRICSLSSRKEILQLYLNINAGGTPHTKEEINKVRAMLKKESKNE